MPRYKDLDFLEIGTSNFNTLVEKATDDTIGISIEPIKFYLDDLPSPKNVEKVNCAISISNKKGSIPLYFVPYQSIVDHNLPNYLRGCNRLSSYHPKFQELSIEHLVECIIVQQIPIKTFLESRNVRKIKKLKIDTEGGDTYILEHLHNYLNYKKPIFYPKQIWFESNKLSSKDRVDLIVNLYSQLGYKAKRKKNDTVLNFYSPVKPNV